MTPLPGRPLVLVRRECVAAPVHVPFPIGGRDLPPTSTAPTSSSPSSVLGELERVADRGYANARGPPGSSPSIQVVPTEVQGDDALVDLGRRLCRPGSLRAIAPFGLGWRPGCGCFFPRGKSHLDRAVSPRQPVPTPRRRKACPGKG